MTREQRSELRPRALIRNVVSRRIGIVRGYRGGRLFRAGQDYVAVIAQTRDGWIGGWHYAFWAIRNCERLKKGRNEKKRRTG